MKLISDNCIVELNDTHISCTYNYILDERIEWELSLQEQLYYTEGKTKRTFVSSSIKEFWFEIEQGIQKAHNLTQTAVAYVVEADQEDAKELFRLCVKEELKLTRQTKSYEFAEEILKKLSLHYCKPYFFKTHVSTKQKTKRLWVSFMLTAIAAAVGIAIAIVVN